MRKDIVRFQNGQIAPFQDEVALEEPLEIRVDNHSVSVTMRTPGNDAELAVGFLVSEGLLRKKTEVSRIEPHPRNDKQNVINVFLSAETQINFQQLTRHVFMSSSCGLCGKASIETVHQHFPKIEHPFSVSASIISQLPDKLTAHQATFARTGGLHAAALFQSDGTLMMSREDVGRHNAVDKVIGWAVLNEIFPLDRHILLVSGRTSFEIMQKALAARIPMICAISAPSSLAAEFAAESGQCLIGFLRENRMNVYANPGAVVFD